MTRVQHAHAGDAGPHAVTQPRGPRAHARDRTHAARPRACNRASGTRRSSATVVIPRSASSRRCREPMPGSSPTGSPSRNSSAASSQRWNSPLGFARAVASRARSLEEPMPALALQPVRVSISRRSASITRAGSAPPCHSGTHTRPHMGMHVEMRARTCSASSRYASSQLTASTKGVSCGGCTALSPPPPLSLTHTHTSTAVPYKRAETPSRIPP